MYDWSTDGRFSLSRRKCFSCCWKDVRLKRHRRWQPHQLSCVSVVVERMYDWSDVQEYFWGAQWTFQLLLKGCTIEADYGGFNHRAVRQFQLLLKGCTIEAMRRGKWISRLKIVSVVVERMYDWSKIISTQKRLAKSFSCCWKDVRLKQTADSFQVRGEGFQLLLKGCTIEAPKPTDWKQMIFDSWFLICFSKMVDLHKKCHYFRKFGEIWVIAWLFLIVIVTSSYILSTTKSP